jgi:bacillolysin
VLGGQVTIHRDDDGNVVWVIGAYYPYIAATNTVRVTVAGAHGFVDRDIGPDGERNVSLMTDPDSGEFFWRVETRRAASRWVHWIGAESGVTLNKFDALTNQACNGGVGYGMEFNSDPSGGDIKDLDCLITPSGSGTQLVTEGGRQETHDQGSSRKPFLGPIATNGDDSWVTPGRQSPGTGALVDAHYYVALADSYYRNLYHFDVTDPNNLDGFIGKIVIHGHFTKNYVNAFWSGTYFAFDDGDGVQFDPLTSLDVAAHEFTHSVTERFLNLIYQGESGALNESFSDIMAAVIERQVDADALLAAGVSPSEEPDSDLRQPDSEWLIGEDFDLRFGENGFRNMADPAEDGQPANYAGFLNTTSDNGGVHTNSGIPNHAFYLLVEVQGVPTQRAGDIFFSGFTGLQSNATFCDARNATIAVAADATEEDKITAAWDGVGDVCGGGGTADNPPTAIFSVSCVNLTCNFTDTSTDVVGTIVTWLWTFDNGDDSSSTSTMQSPPSKTYPAAGTYAVSLKVTDDASSTQMDTATQDVTVSDGSGGPAVGDIFPASMVAADSSVTVMIGGSGFGTNTGDVTVTFQNGSGPAPVASVTSVTDGSITANVSVNVKGKKGSSVWDVVVTTPNGSGVLTDAFTVSR